MPEETVTFEHFQIARREDGSLFELGRGAMGVTYKAYDTRLDGFVALKVINPGYLNDEVGRERFLREARAAAHLDHPNVAAIFHRGQEGGNYFYAMQFIEGETVDAFVRRRGPLPTALALRIVLQAAQGLAAANARGLIHRDIKPANLMLVHLDGSGPATGGDINDDDLLVKVIDFGLAKVVLDDKGGSELSLTGEGPIGTPYYMSPEQIDSSVGDVDARTDIYSLGVTLWYLLTGQPPFVGTQFQVFRQHISAAPPLSRLPATVPESVRSLLDRMLAKTPTERPANTRDLITTLRELLRGPLSLESDENASTLPMLPVSRVDSAPLPAAIPPAAYQFSPNERSETVLPPEHPGNPADTHRPPPLPLPPGAYQPPTTPGNSTSTFTPPPMSGSAPAGFPTYLAPGNPSSGFPAGPYQPPPTVKKFGREWMIFGGVLLGALLIGGILLGYLVSKSRSDKQAANNTPPPATSTLTPGATAAEAAPTATAMPAASAANTPRRSSAADAAGVAPDASNAPSGSRKLTVPGQYPTIQAAIDAARSGDTVRVGAGTFTEKLIFKDGVRLLGAGIDQTVVSTPGDGEALTAKKCASGTVAGFTFEHTGTKKGSDVSYVVWLDGSAINVRSCRVRNSTNLGLGCENGDKSVVEDCEVLGSHNNGMRSSGEGTAPTFRNNHVHDNAGTGISFYKGGGGTAENNVSEGNVEFGFSIVEAGTAPVITGNTSRANKMSGFTYQDGGGGSAQDNTVEDNHEGGIRLSGKGTEPKVIRNRVRRSGLSGFIIVEGAGGVIDENASEENADYGMLVNGAGTAPTVTNNQFTGNKKIGIDFSEGAKGTAVSNTTTGSQVGIRVLGKGTEPTVRENQICNNSTDGIAVRDGARGVFEGNVCESNAQYGIGVYGAGTSPVLNGNRTDNNKKDGVYVEKGATPKRSGKYDGFFK